MHPSAFERLINEALLKHNVVVNAANQSFYERLQLHISAVSELYNTLYGGHPEAALCFYQLIENVVAAYAERSTILKSIDNIKLQQDHWFLSNDLAGMSLYVDRFCGQLNALSDKLPYLKNLGVNFLHVMPLFKSPTNESDGGYAVSDFREVDEKFGTLQDLQQLINQLQQEGFYLMIDIVLNHTSHHHEWAQKAKAREKQYQDYYYMFDDRGLPDAFDSTMPEVFPEVAPGNFTWNEECSKWVMTVFHNYQWDLNYTNPQVFIEMLNNIFFYANLGIDVLRIDAPAFIWKQLGTTCQNLPKAHTLLRLIKQCVAIATPGMALLGEAIVAPTEIIKYFGTDNYTAQECDVAYNATQMALQWDALATTDTRVMLAAQKILLQKPYGTTWINYTRCHDDIGLGYDDWMIQQAGFNAYEHRKFLKEYYTGSFYNSPARGALFAVNIKTQDARISGTLASLCGLEKAMNDKDETAIITSINKITMMQAHSFFTGGIPMLFYGDEAGYTNDYSYLQDESKSYDNRWMHRPLINWKKNEMVNNANTVEGKIYANTKKLLTIRKQLTAMGDYKNIQWLTPHNIHVAGFVRSYGNQQLYCLFNYNNQTSFITWYVFKETGKQPVKLYNYWTEKEFVVGRDDEYFELPPYGFCIMETI